MEMVLNYFKSLDVGSYVVIVAFIVILILLYVFRKTPTVVGIILEAMDWVENEQNSEKGKAKRAMAIQIIRSKLPKILQFIITDSLLITLIEMILNSGAKIFGVSKKVDIEGNEANISAEVNENIAKVNYESRPEFVEDTDKDTRVYAEAEAKTDFKGNEDMSVKVGIEKKF